MRLRASYTLENSIIIPQFTIIIVIIVTLCFYMHDNIILKNAALKLCVRIEFEENINTDSLIEAGEDYIEEKTLLLGDINIKYKEIANKYEVDTAGTFFSGISSFYSFNKLQKEAVISKNKPDEFIRMINAVKDTLYRDKY